ncbi:50S ribosomal protein L10, partial [Patescibacteria group bacterium]|nr:50S ribosomal protein L10 [Patescibacteria group bacterium]
MALTRIQKENIVKKIKEGLDKQKSIVFVSVDGLKADDLFELRTKLKEAGCLLMVAKKTLMGIAFKDANIDIDKDKLIGEVALVFGFEDEVLPAKTTYEFSKKNKNLKIVGGFLEDKFREVSEIITLAQIPSRKELLAKVVGSISAPVSGFANVLQGNLRN